MTDTTTDPAALALAFARAYYYRHGGGAGTVGDLADHVAPLLARVAALEGALGALLAVQGNVPRGPREAQVRFTEAKAQARRALQGRP